MELIAVGIVAAVALVFVAHPLVNPRRYLYYLEDMLGLGDQKKLNYLLAQRNLVYENIKDLEAEHEIGKLAEDDYRRLRQQLFAEAQSIVHQVDEEKVKREIEDLIESDARSQRRIKSDG